MIYGQTGKSEIKANIEYHVYGSVTPVTISSTGTYVGRVLALTPDFAKLSISPESSDGFASVGTILPKEEATLLPGGLFAFFVQLLGEKRYRVTKRKRNHKSPCRSLSEDR